MPLSRFKCIHTPSSPYASPLFLGGEVGLEVRRAVVLGAAAGAGVLGPLAAGACGGRQLVLGDGLFAGWRVVSIGCVILEADVEVEMNEEGD